MQAFCNTCCDFHMEKTGNSCPQRFVDQIQVQKPMLVASTDPIPDHT